MFKRKLANRNDGWYGHLFSFFQVRYTQPCLDHDYNTMVPIVLSSHIPNLAMGSAQPSTTSTRVLAETRTLLERIQIPGSSLHLTFQSTSTSGSLSLLTLRMTPSSVPPTLSKVFLSIKVAGRFFKTTLEADANLEYTYGWDKRNVYNQKVYGIVEAVVAVGYQYEKTCGAKPIWAARMVKLRGFDVDISNVGNGWNLEVHHHYNVDQGMTFSLAFLHMVRVKNEKLFRSFPVSQILPKHFSPVAFSSI